MPSIPRIIHQTWKNSDIPEPYHSYQQSVREQHPDWEHRLWTDADNRAFIAEEYPEFLPTYDGYSHEIERVDAVRYFILLKFGGVYLDLDMECLKPLDGLLSEDNTAYFGQLALPTIDNCVTGNAFMAAPAAHPLFAYITKQLPRVIKSDITHADVLDNTGPYMLSRQLEAFGPLCAHQKVSLSDVCDYDVLTENPAFAGKSVEQIYSERLLYLVHRHSNSWNIQHPPPMAVEGFTVLLDCDIPGADIGYVEYPPGAYQQIAERCISSEGAVAFNYNGYIKSAAAELEAVGKDSAWLKPGQRAWVAVRNEHVSSLDIEGFELSKAE